MGYGIWGRGAGNDNKTKDSICNCAGRSHNWRPHRDHADHHRTRQMDLLEFKTPLHEAAHNAQVDKVKELLAAGASVTEVDSLDQTPLIMAVRRRAENEEESEKMAACAKLFIDAGADVNAFDKNGEACIHLAVMSGGGVEKVAVLKTLLDAKADTTLVSDTFKMTALQYAFTALLPLPVLSIAVGPLQSRPHPPPLRAHRRELGAAGSNLNGNVPSSQLGGSRRAHRDREAAHRGGLP